MGDTSAHDSSGPTDRYLVALPEGIQQWVRTPVASCERMLMLHILSHPGGCKVAVKALSHALVVETKALSEALFVLNRHQGIRVLTRPQPITATSLWTCLNNHLTGMSQRSNATGIALADPYGLCIASAHVSEFQAQQLAAVSGLENTNRTVQLVPLFVDLNHQPFSVCSHEPIEGSDPGWVALAHCLVMFFKRPTASSHAVSQS